MAERVTSGRCWSCDEKARGGSVVRRGVEEVKLCRKCLTKDETERFLTHRQAARLAAAARRLGGRAELLVTIGLNLGPRISELTAMKGNDFDYEEGRVLIATLKRKGHPRLPVYFNPELGEVFRGLIGPTRGFLFPRQSGAWGRKRGGHVGRWTGNRIFKTVAEEAGLSPRFSSHSMRHYCTIKTLESTGDVYFTSKQLRHASLKTTEIYLHLLPGHAAMHAGKVPVT